MGSVTYSVLGLNEGIVDSDDLDVVVLDGIAEDNATDTAEAIDANLDDHFDCRERQRYYEYKDRSKKECLGIRGSGSMDDRDEIGEEEESKVRVRRKRREGGFKHSAPGPKGTSESGQTIGWGALRREGPMQAGCDGLWRENLNGYGSEARGREAWEGE